MNISRCVNCMEDMENVSGTICPRCHFDNARAAEAQSPYAIRQNSILHGRYLIGNVLGQGGFGITYIAFDLVLSIKVAIKEYFPMGIAMRDPGSSNTLLWHSTQVNTEQRQSGQESFLKEARRIAKIDQIPSIVRVRDTFFDNETAYIVMDFVEGITLKDKLIKGGSISFSECMRYLTPMMEGLAQVHKAGIIHRDISPDNIIIQANGSVKLLDLGAAKDISTGQGQQSQLVAKKGFSPLEQYTEAGRIGPWTDVYALCATIYYCVTGKLVLNALDRMGNEEIVFPESMEEPLAAHVKLALKAGLALEAKNRIQSVEELLARLKDGEAQTQRASAEVKKQSGKPDGAVKNKGRKAGRRMGWVGAVAAVLAGLFIIIALAGGQGRNEISPTSGEGAETENGTAAGTGSVVGTDMQTETIAGMEAEAGILKVEALGTSNANLLNDGGNVLFAGDYEYFLTADSSLYVCKYNQDKNNSYVNSGDKVCDTALYLTLGSDKIYFLSTVNGHSAVCQADQNGDNFVQLYSVTGRQELSFRQYVKFSDHREYLYFLMENVAGEMGASLYRCDLSGNEVELLIEGNLIWYNLYKDSVYYTCMRESDESFEVLLMRAGFDGQGEEILNADKQFL
ncbi:MAG: protein kinase, partial [Acetatifactor sp.]|nr:protein kinase [Acetatifactor sp.]